MWETRLKSIHFCSFVMALTQLAISLGCYKVTLNCADDKVGYYSSMGFKKEEGNANFLMLRVQNKS